MKEMEREERKIEIKKCIMNKKVIMILIMERLNELKRKWNK